MNSWKLLNTAPTVLVLACVMGSAAWAQDPPTDETVFVADVNNTMYRIAGAGAATVFSIGGTNFRDIVVTDDLNFIIANHTGNGTLLIADQTGASRVITGAIPFPEGLDMGPDGNVYVSTDGDNKIYKLVRDYTSCPSPAPGCPNGGYVASPEPGFPITVTGATLIADVAVVWSDPTGALDPGDILVAVAKPASIRRYTKTGASSGELAVSFEGEQPSAMAFGPSGSLLVTTEQGSLFQIPTGGGAAIAKVNGKAKDVVFGINGGAQAAFVSVDPGSVQKFAFSDGQLVSPPTATYTGFNNPHGIGFAAAGGATLTSANPNVQTPAGLTKFEQVNIEGQTDAECYFFEDVAGLRRSDGTLHLQDVATFPQFLRDQFDANDVVIPSTVRGFVPDGGSTPLHRLCITKTTAGVEGIKEIHSEEEIWLNRAPGDDLPCPLDLWEGVTEHANSFYAPEIGKQEYPIIDWDGGDRVVQNVTTTCGSDGSWSRGRGSLVVLSAQDWTPRDVLVSNSLALLDRAVSSSSRQAVGGLSDFIQSRKLANSLRRTLRSARGSASRGRFVDVVSSMTSLLDDVNGSSSSDFTPAGTPVTVPIDGQTVSVFSPDVKAELKVRANAIRFQACSQLSVEGTPRPSDCDRSVLSLP